MSHSISGTEPLESGLGIDLDLPIVRNKIGPFHATPDQARQLAAFLIAQADAPEAWADANLTLLNGERSSAIGGEGAGQ